MSSIKVWTSDGNWSASVNGCDKVHLMKEAILTECDIVIDRYSEINFVSPGHYEGVVKEDRIIESIPDCWLQIENKAINVGDLIDYDKKVDISRLDFANANFFKMRFTTLLIMAENEESMSALYNKLMLCAKLPEKVAKNYCLLFMFSNE